MDYRITKDMLSLLVFNALLLGTQAGLIRVPKIYNAIVSTKQNLTPSQAIPVVEPVYRTTALGVLFPPAILHSASDQQSKAPIDDRHHNLATPVDNKSPKNEGKPTYYHGSLYPVAIDPYFAYSYHNNLVVPTLPVLQQPLIPPALANPLNVEKEPEKPEIQSVQGVKAAIDFQKNPEVPDVPLPPLPVRSGTTGS